jgi:hypothetical protein
VTNSFKRLSFWLTGVSNLLRHGLVILIVLSFLTGVVMTFRAVPAATALDQQEYHLIQDLLNIHVTHIYSEYWTCGRIIFQSQEKITCAVVDDHMQVSHNRYEPYAETVVADPHAAYIFPTGPVDAAYVKNCVQRFASSKIHYLRFAFDDYVIFVPG